MKKYLILIVLTLLVVSCSKEDNFDKELNNSLESKILDFSSLEEMEKRINEIRALKELKESNIFEKILLKNNITKPLQDYLSKKLTSKKDFNYSDIKEDLEFYHRERLNRIYELKRELGFTSLQCIAEEINSLKLLNPKKSEELYNKYSDLLVKSKFETSSRFGEMISTVLNKEGKVKVNGKLLDLNPNISMMRNIGPIEIDDGGNQIESGNLLKNDSGILMNLNDNVMVEWSVGKQRDYNNIFYRYAYFNRLRGFVRIESNSNTFVSYPITINVGVGSKITFIKFGTSNRIYVNFRQTGTDLSFFNYQSRSGSFVLDKLIIAPSTFSAVVNGEVYTMSTEQFSRDYGFYDPDNPIYN